MCLEHKPFEKTFSTSFFITNEMNPFIILLIILASFLLIYLVVYTIYQKFLKRYEKFQLAVGKENIINATKRCVFQGQRSKTSNQIRGNGFFALTDDEIFFEMFLPKKVFQIMYEDINRVYLTKKYLNQYRPKQMMIVEFDTAQEKMDSVGLSFKNPEEWTEKTRRLVSIEKDHRV